MPPTLASPDDVGVNKRGTPGEQKTGPAGEGRR